MAKHFKQNCILCNSPAEYCEVDAGNNKYFKCLNCGMFQISKRAEKILENELANRKPAYSAQAKATPPDHLLFIRTPALESQRINNEKLQAEYTSKSELCLNCR